MIRNIIEKKVESLGWRIYIYMHECTVKGSDSTETYNMMAGITKIPTIPKVNEMICNQ